MDYQFWTGVAALALTAYGCVLQRRAVQLMTAQVQAKKKPTVELPVWWKTPLLKAMAGLTVLCWIPYFISPPDEIPNDGTLAGVIVEWGILPDQYGVPRMVARGDRLLRYQSEYRLLGLCFFWDGMGDAIDATPIQKSNLYDISSGEISILINVNKELLSQSKGSVNFALLLVPKGTHPDQFSSIRQAQAFGAKFVWKGSTL